MNTYAPRIFLFDNTMKTREWSPARRNQALGLMAGGRHSLHEITNITTIPKGTIGDLKKRGTAISLPRSGRPTKFTERDKRHIEIYVRTNSKTRRTSLRHLIRDLSLNASENTVRKALRELGYDHKVAKRRPFLKKLDRKRRLQYAKRHQHWTVEDWARVIFTDEMAVKIGMERHSKDMVWRKDGEALHPDCINYRKRPSGTGMMFWGAFRMGKMGPGLFFDLEAGKHINFTVYRDQVLVGPLKEFWEDAFGDVTEPIVLEDNAPPHKKVCIPVRTDLGMICHQHPPNSPDLNPIENIWCDMKRIIAKDYSHITSRGALMRAVVNIWNNYGDEKWDGLIASMPDRMQAVIAAKGGSTHY